jgi:hypothetical protein
VQGWMECERGESKGRQGGTSIRVVDQRSRVGEYILRAITRSRDLARGVIRGLRESAMMRFYRPRAGKMDRGNMGDVDISDIKHLPLSTEHRRRLPREPVPVSASLCPYNQGGSAFHIPKVSSREVLFAGRVGVFRAWLFGQLGTRHGSFYGHTRRHNVKKPRFRTMIQQSCASRRGTLADPL